MKRFYGPFAKDLADAKKKMPEVKHKGLATDLKCELDGGDMVIKWGRNGEFLACSNYPKCTNTGEIARDEQGNVTMKPPSAPVPSDEVCEKCGKPMVKKRSRFGEFLGCSGYPDCDGIKRLQSDPVKTGVACPECKEGEILERRSRRGKIFFGCGRYPKCKFAAWNKVVLQPCPSCGANYMVEKDLKRTGITWQHGDRSRSLLAAFLVGALPGDAGALQILLDHVVRAARRAWLQHDFVPCGELALRVAAASEENLPAAAATLEDFAFLAFRARDSGLDRVGLQALDAVAIRVARASEEFAEARAAFDHRLAALFADLVSGRRRRRLERDDALFVARDFAGVGAFGIVRAGEKLAVAAPFDHHIAAVELALETGGQALVLDLGHFL